MEVLMSNPGDSDAPSSLRTTEGEDGQRFRSMGSFSPCLLVFLPEVIIILNSVLLHSCYHIYSMFKQHIV